MRTSLASALVVCLLVPLLGCNTNPEDNTAKSVVASPTEHASRTFLVPGHSALGLSRFSPPAPSGAQGEPESGELQWTKPAAWDEVPSGGGMRIATYRIHRAKDATSSSSSSSSGAPNPSEDAEMSVTRVGGDVESNVQRWVGQFEEKPTPTRKEFKFEHLKATVVKLTGTFTAGGMPGGDAAAPKPNTTLLAIIVEAGGDPYFFKLTGPQATVESATQDFGGLVQSLRVAPPALK